MCRNIRTLHNFEPPATEDEIRASALQYVRKISGSTKPSHANEAVFARLQGARTVNDVKVATKDVPGLRINLDPEVTIGSARDLRQVGDRQHLRARCKPLQRLPDRMRRLTADSGIDLVEDKRLAAADSSDREGDAGKLAARRRLCDGRERQAVVRTDLERHRVGSRHSGACGLG